MPQSSPKVTLIHHDFHNPVYTPAELAGLREEVRRIEKHIGILEEELARQRAQLAGLKHLLK